MLAVRMPLNDAIAHTNSEFRSTLWFLTFAGGTVLILFGLTMRRLRKQKFQAQQTTRQLSFNQHELILAKRQLETAHGHLRERASDLDRSRRAALNLMSDMRQARDAAEASTQSKSEFLANMSHEIRTPMTAILGFNDIILDTATEKDHIDAARTVKENGEYLISLISDILDLSKIEAGKLAVEQFEFPPHEVISSVASLMNVRLKNETLPTRFTPFSNAESSIRPAALFSDSGSDSLMRTVKECVTV